LKYRDAVALRTALEQRLNDRSRREGIALGRLRKQVAFERLLARLVQAAPNRWILKGALALDFRLGQAARATKDMDLGRIDDADGATEDLQAAAALDLGDFFNFSVERTRGITQENQDVAVRFQCRAELAGRLFEELVVDVGFSSSFVLAPVSLRTPDHLGFAGIPPVDVPAIPLELHIAEKLHAYSRTYSDGRSSTRVKDLADILLVAKLERLAAEKLHDALRLIFDQRERQRLPQSIPKPPPDWSVPYRRLAAELGLPPDLASAHAAAAAFLDPVLAARGMGEWDPVRHAWTSEA
jgi:predicted nucleotidyltransferase component of viral defense system